MNLRAHGVAVDLSTPLSITHSVLSRQAAIADVLVVFEFGDRGAHLDDSPELVGFDVPDMLVEPDVEFDVGIVVPVDDSLIPAP